MGLGTVTYATCDTCEARSTPFSAAIYSKVDAAQILHASGWTRFHRTLGAGFDYACPSCAAKAAKRAAPQPLKGTPHAHR